MVSFVFDTYCIVLQRTLVIASDMMLIGFGDSEFMSRVGEFCLSLLQQGIFDLLLTLLWCSVSMETSG